MNDLIFDEVQTIDVPGLLNGAKYYKVISKIMENIHSKIPAQVYDLTKIAAPTDIREEYFNGVNYKRAVMYLLSNGCEWALKSAHGCTVCGHLAKQTRDENIISVENYLKQFNSEFNRIDFENYPLLNLYNNGSFLNSNEIPSDARRKMLSSVNSNPYIKMLVLETRPEFVQEEVVDEIAQMVKDKHVEIAIGLEVADDFLRYICLNKGFSLKKYQQAADILCGRLHLRTYVMLKPPFLTERESISQTVETIKQAFSAGSTTVSLETCTIQNFTLTNYLYEKSYYKTAWLWSIIEVVKQTANLGKLVVGMFQFYPSPSKVPYNCSKCSDMVMECIKKYNRTLDVKVFDGLTCDCRMKWEKELMEEAEPFTKRLDSIWKNLLKADH